MKPKGKLLERGLLQIYTGDGKGKTTAAIGQALRILAHGGRVCLVQFFKPKESSEVRILREHFPDLVDIKQVGGTHPCFSRQKNPQEREKARTRCEQDWQRTKKSLQVHWYDLVILDEVNIALRDDLLPREEILTFLREKPTQQELIFTGRGAPEKIIQEADLVTRMEKVKHPFDQRTKARKGIEY